MKKEKKIYQFSPGDLVGWTEDFDSKKTRFAGEIRSIEPDHEAMVNLASINGMPTGRNYYRLVKFEWMTKYELNN